MRGRRLCCSSGTFVPDCSTLFLILLYDRSTTYMNLPRESDSLPFLHPNSTPLLTGACPHGRNFQLHHEMSCHAVNLDWYSLRRGTPAQYFVVYAPLRRTRTRPDTASTKRRKRAAGRLSGCRAVDCKTHGLYCP